MIDMPLQPPLLTTGCSPWQPACKEPPPLRRDRDLNSIDIEPFAAGTCKTLRIYANPG